MPLRVGSLLDIRIFLLNFGGMSLKKAPFGRWNLRLFCSSRGEEQPSCSTVDWLKSERKSDFSPADYESLFTENKVQSLLEELTGKSARQIFHAESRTRKRNEVDVRPTHRLMTDEDIQQTIAEMERKSALYLQMPPILRPRTRHVNEILTKDGEIAGFDASKHVFVDISVNASPRERMVSVREPNGTLRTGTVEELNRMNRIFFPSEGRSVTKPDIFCFGHFEDALSRRKHLTILDFASYFFEPDDPDYISVVTRTYDDIDKNSSYHLLWASRHYGGLVFYLVLNRTIFGLLDSLATENRVKEMGCVIELYHIFHPTSSSAVKSKGVDDVEQLVQILAEESENGDVAKKLSSAAEKLTKYREGEENSQKESKKVATVS